MYTAGWNWHIAKDWGRIPIQKCSLLWKLKGCDQEALVVLGHLPSSPLSNPPLPLQMEQDIPWAMAVVGQMSWNPSKPRSKNWKQFQHYIQLMVIWFGIDSKIYFSISCARVSVYFNFLVPLKRNFPFRSRYFSHVTCLFSRGIVDIWSFPRSIFNTAGELAYA